MRIGCVETSRAKLRTVVAASGLASAVACGGAFGQSFGGSLDSADPGVQTGITAPSHVARPDGPGRAPEAALIAPADSPAWTMSERVAFDRPDVERLKAEDFLNANTGSPRRIGVNFALGAEIDGRSDWTPAPGGGVVWRQTLVAEDAVGVRVWFDRLDLPEGAWAQIADADGAFVERLARPARDGAPVWSSILDGDTARVEVWLPDASMIGAAGIEVGGISHVYRGVTELSGIGQITGSTVPCSQFVDCADLGPTEPSVSAVGRMCFARGSSLFVCSGALISDLDDETTRQLFLTAEHCIGTQSVADTLVVTWDYESESCTPVVAGFSSLEQTSGSELLRALPEYDTTLLELTEPLESERVFAGWSTRVPRVSEDLHGVHHPGGGPKEYSRYIVADGSVNFSGISRNEFHILRTQVGAIRGGSSGSPLFNEDGLVIGVASFTAVVPNQLTDTCIGTESAQIPVGYGRFDGAFPFIEPFLERVAPDSNAVPVIADLSLAPDEIRAGDTAPVTATAVGVSDADGDDQIVNVTFWIDVDANGVLENSEVVGVDTDGADGYAVAFDASSLDAGLYTVSAIATDSNDARSFAVVESLTVTAAVDPGGTLVPGGVVEFSSETTPVEIPAFGVITDSIIVADNRCITDVDVSVDIAHTEISDLIVELRSPAGTVVRLHSRTGFGESDLSANYNDEGFAPDGPGLLSDFDGEQSAGAWRLTIDDGGSGGAGELLAWSVTISAGEPGCAPTTSPPSVRSLSVDPGRVRSGSGATVLVEALVREGSRALRSVTFGIDVDGNGSLDDGIVATDRSLNRGWSATLDPGDVAAGTYSVLAFAEDNLGTRSAVARAAIEVLAAETVVRAFDGRVGVAAASSGGRLFVGDPGGARTPAASGSVEVRTVATPEADASQTLEATTPTALDLFGSAVARDGSVLAIGSPGDDTRGADAGAVYVFRLDGTAWTLRQTLFSSNATPGSLFGSALALSRGVLVVGSPLGPDGGSVEVFESPGASSFVSAGILGEADFTGDNGRYGQSVATDGTTIVVGAPHAGARGAFAGEAFAYRRGGGTVGDGLVNIWNTTTRLEPGAPQAGDLLGSSVAVEGDLVAVGARGADGPSQSPRANAGEVVVFRRTDGAFQFEDVLRDTGGGLPNVGVGTSVAIASGQIAAGGPGVRTSPVGTAPNGLALLFERQGSVWTVVERVAGSSTGFGYNVDFDGADLLIGFSAASGSGVVSLEDVLPPASAPTARAVFADRVPTALAPTVDQAVRTRSVSRFGACGPADLAAPFGLIDAADTAVFTRLFERRDSTADLNADGRLDAFDIVAFERLTAEGCR